MKKFFSNLHPRNLPMGVQLFIVFFSTCAIFIIIESILFSYLSNKLENHDNYASSYTTAQSFIQEISQSQTDPYLLIKDFTNSTMNYVLVTDSTYQLSIEDSLIEISIDGYHYFIPYIDNNLKVGDTISYCADLQNGILYSINDYVYHPTTKTASEGIIGYIDYPPSLNSTYKENILVTTLLAQLQAGEIILTKDEIPHALYDFEDKSFHLFITAYQNGNLIIISPALIGSKLDTNLSLFQFLLFGGMSLLFIGLAFFMNNTYVKPIEEITYVATNIKNLNFGVYANEYQNKDYKKLSTEINDLSDSLKDVFDNLNYKNDEITLYNQKLEKEYQFKKQLVATISHEIKTPLAVIQATISGVVDHIFEGEEADKELNNVLDEIENTNQMLQEIVQLYELEGNHYQLDLKLIDMNEIIQKSISLLEKIAEKYHQTIIYTFDRSFFVYADYKQMTRVINNILLNAITYSPPHNKIIIDVKEYKTHCICEVINYGVNIPSEDIEKLFEPFYRLDRSRKRSEDHGNGLGLYLVRETLEKHGFEYGIDNIINGVKFHIIFNMDNSNSDK